jgi:hypothetical protein
MVGHLSLPFLPGRYRSVCTDGTAGRREGGGERGKVTWTVTGQARLSKCNSAEGLNVMGIHFRLQLLHIDHIALDIKEHGIDLERFLNQHCSRVIDPEIGFEGNLYGI